MYYSRNVFTPRKRHVGRWIALALAGLLVLFGAYTVFDNGRVAVRQQRVFVSGLPKSLEGFTILHVSDLGGKRFGAGQAQLAAALKGRRYSAVCMTGDMVGPQGDANPLLELLSVLDADKPVYMIAGDADPSAVGGQGNEYSVLADWVLTATQTRGAVFLGAPQLLEVGSARVWFSDASQLSLDLDRAGEAYAASTTAVSAYGAQVIAETKAARLKMYTDDLHIALSHMPLGAEFVQRMQTVADSEYNVLRTVDLIAAGGTVGGQWRIPGVGGVWSEGWFPPEDRTRGYHYAGSVGLAQYISAGLGVNAMCPLPGFRLLNTPEVTLLTFTAEMEPDAVPQR